MLNQAIIAELKHEAAQTRKILERVPLEKSDWKPHEKSMTLGKLANHLAGITGYIPIMMQTDVLDVRKGKLPLGNAGSSNELLSTLDQHLADTIESIEKVDESFLRTPWTLTNGDHTIFTLPRIAAIRAMAISHLIHHRGQLSVYLRLLDVPVPGMYGPSADDIL